MKPDKRIAMLERVLTEVTLHPIDYRFSAETWRHILKDLQQLCHKAAVQKDFDIDAYEAEENWQPVAVVRLSSRSGH